MYYIGFNFEDRKFYITEVEEKAVSFTHKVNGKVECTRFKTRSTDTSKVILRIFNDYQLDEELRAYSPTDQLCGKIGKCKTCGRPFFMYATEMDFFDEKGLPLPRRCYFCRAHRKAGENK